MRRPVFYDPASPAAKATPSIVDPARLKAQYDVTEPAPLLNPMAQAAAGRTGSAKAPLAPAKPPAPQRTGLMAPKSGGASSGQSSSFSAS